MAFLQFTASVSSALALAGSVFAADVAPKQLKDRSPFYIAPVIEGLFICVDAKRRSEYRHFFDAQSLCALNQFNGATALAKLLDPLEPGGPAGQVQLGYTATIPLLGLYEKNAEGQWAIDTARIDDYLALISSTNRPVVIYLIADHFDTKGPLAEALATDKTNLMQLPNGTAPTADYFGNKVLPFTLLADDDLPVNRYRFEAARYVAQRIAALPASVQSRVIAVTMAGELHQMFPDFANGMGTFADVQVTDYSPRSVAGFRNWLKQKYGSIGSFNKATGFDYSSFDTLPVPARNIRRDKLGSFGEHYDGFAHGELPVSGWLWDPHGRVDKLELFVDGKPTAEVPRGLNRLDVYRAVEKVTNPNTGFRFDLPFDQMTVGRHVGQVVATSKGKQHLLGQFDFNVIGRDQGKLPDRSPSKLESLVPITKLPDVRAWLDLPKSPQDVYFNPIARDWNEFRGRQVLDFLTKFHDLAREAGIAEDKLYSHQIVPQVNSSWNAKLFAVDQSLSEGLPWRAGLNMYGGAADSAWMRAFVESRGLAEYGVPEFNPQQWKVPGVHREAMLSHYRAGARFISPYYLSIISSLTLAGRKELNRLEIRADNPVEGSSEFYTAIEEFVKR